MPDNKFSLSNGADAGMSHLRANRCSLHYQRRNQWFFSHYPDPRSTIKNHSQIISCTLSMLRLWFKQQKHIFLFRNRFSIRLFRYFLNTRALFSQGGIKQFWNFRNFPLSLAKRKVNFDWLQVSSKASSNLKSSTRFLEKITASNRKQVATIVKNRLCEF